MVWDLGEIGLDKDVAEFKRGAKSQGIIDKIITWKIR